MDNNSLKNASLFDNDPVLYAAWLYYQDGLSQSEVANIMGVSRVTVVKYLHLAREKGFVNINLDSSVFSTIDYALRIKAKFDLNNVLILPDEEKNKSQHTLNMNRERLAKAGAMYLSQIINDDDILGVAWGRTIYKLGNYLSPKSLKNITVLQMIGAVAPQPDFKTTEAAALIANKLSGCSINLHVPAVVSSARLAMELQAEPIIRRSFSALNQCNKALFVVGNTFDDNPLVTTGVLTSSEMAQYRDLGAVGVICGRFYDAQGNPLVSDIDLRIMGISLAQLRQITQRLFIAGGVENIQATIGAIKGGYATDIVIDEVTALALLELDN
ncbi:MULTISPECIES: sugar-binding transcriptional regulator [Proteus]|uniref:Deoxyribonucleoside regulator n=1 Tax=Proteus penneri TaxID=102862 RepID=A0A0G4QAX8_9GAMM|nr:MULTISPECIES: sugar-binding transcriptional regulator [Proteus]MBJ2116756.1 sugar-binding transcriptional regulator [Proteus penneri]MCO8050769.1 sugar-binding transcriptional regulator [Proteus penneri]MCX2588219.1 sugar-binding transcriptional regulator [Proteus penneri]NBL78126.1 transcriptional regulator [Proteus sp. G2672]NBL91634.1 transcriptional regulator [Proteus sp. G2673]